MTSHNYLFKNDISDPDNNVYGWLDFYDKQVDNVVDNSGLTYEDFFRDNSKQGEIGDVFVIDNDENKAVRKVANSGTITYVPVKPAPITPKNELEDTAKQFLQNQVTETEVNQASENSGNKINTSNTNNKMSNGNSSGANYLANYINTGRNYVPSWRERDKVDDELSRGGRLSPLIAVGQHRDSPHRGWTNDFYTPPIGGLPPTPVAPVAPVAGGVNPSERYFCKFASCSGVKP